MAGRLRVVPSRLALAQIGGPASAKVTGGVTTPFGGVVTFRVGAGDRVSAGEVVATIEAMKLEAAITTPVSGRVDRLVIPDQAQVEGGDLLLVVS